MDRILKNKYDSIIFDLDGTLWDSSANVVLAWQAAKEQVDYIKEDFTQPMIHSITGMTYKAIFETLLPYLDEAQREEFKALAGKYELEILYEKGGELYPDLEKALQYLSARYKLFIVSNCQSGYIEVFFKISGFEHYFMGHQCYGTKNQPKAENITDIIVDHNLKAPVYVGDTMGDYQAATKAGVPFIFVDYGFGVVNEDQVATASRLGDLAEIL
ncbi:HAD family hydrolase [Mucilaginibacter sp. UR6-11]|uniref:HAD family hydrolase n=1 Tax=Mucilaginibacter sp. UR6-11 TaxID=1435644 RepID=UPI001E4535EE|nr:HAD family hydrolase [Mucilaginibacter sp. UR6-11]MCC8423809.1 HAD family hydrolase [Mucilaginibacter sp. UR6-11]